MKTGLMAVKNKLCTTGIYIYIYIYINSNSLIVKISNMQISKAN